MQNKIQISNNLQKLIINAHQKLGKTIYVVGGFVRNSLLSLNSNDIDLCGEVLPDQISDIAKECGFLVNQINKKLGTMQIIAGTEVFEYTTFRIESYAKQGEHKPQNVVFTTDLVLDAKRRDFTINAIYYNVIKQEIVDPFNGLQDLKNKIVKTTQNPFVTFSDDGLRILRFVRFVSELGFNWDKKTFSGAKQFAYLLTKISKERVSSEIKAIVSADSKYSGAGSHVLGFKLIKKLGLLKYIINQNFNNVKLRASGPYYRAYKNSKYQMRYIAFLCLVLNSKLNKPTTNANLVLWANLIAGQQGLRESNYIIKQLHTVFAYSQKLLAKKQFSNMEVVQFKNMANESQDYLALINAKAVSKLLSRANTMKEAGVPFTQTELKITSKQLLDLGVEQTLLSTLRNIMYEKCVQGELLNAEQELVEFVKSNYGKYQASKIK